MAPQKRKTLRDLAGVSGASNVLLAQFLMAVGANMTMLALTLLSLHEFGSPGFAGLVVFVNNLGVIVAPFGGTILDAFGKKRLIVLDFVVSIVSLATIGYLGLANALSKEVLIALSAVSGITSSLSLVGLRTALPAVVPDDLLDMATGMTFNARAVARVVGPLVPGFIAALGDPAWALYVCAALYGLALMPMLFFHDVSGSRAPDLRIYSETLSAIRLTFSDVILRRVSAFTMVAFVGWGAINGAMAPLVEDTLSRSAALVGVIMAVFGLADVMGGLVTAHRDTRNREWVYLAWGVAIASVGLFACSSAWLPLVFIGAALVGAAETPVDHVIHVLRQRVIDPALLGRMVAIGSSISVIFWSIGVAVAGYISNTSPQLAFVVGGLVTGVAVFIPIRYERV